MGESMILKRNLQRVCEHARHSRRVLAVGGTHAVLNAATHVIDFVPYTDGVDPVDPQNARHFAVDNWVSMDLCARPWPFPDKYFDFSFCSHFLEDVRDPVAVLRELSRVSRAGYIETPTRAREIFMTTRHPRLAGWLGHKIEIGFSHHRWYVESFHGQFRFLAKTAETTSSPDYVLTRRELGRDLTEEESGLGVFWSDRTEGQELLFQDSQEISYELRGFKQRILYHLKAADPPRAFLGRPSHA